MTRVKLDGFTLEKRWHGRVLQEIKDHKPVEVWKRDIRHHDSDPEILVYHPIVEFPSAAEKANYHKQWQPEFFEDNGTVVVEGTTMDNCRNLGVLIARNIGSRSVSDYFRAYTRTPTNGKRGSMGDWYEMVTGDKATMHADWYSEVTRKGYLKYLSLSETQHLEWYVEYELTLKAAQSYKLFCQRYKQQYGKEKEGKGKKKQKVEKVEKKKKKEQVEEAEAPQADDDDEPPRKRKQRSDRNVSRNKVTNLRVVTSTSCVTTRQIKYNGKWHELVEVCNIIVCISDMCVCVVQRLVCLCAI